MTEQQFTFLSRPVKRFLLSVLFCIVMGLLVVMVWSMWRRYSDEVQDSVDLVALRSRTGALATLASNFRSAIRSSIASVENLSTYIVLSFSSGNPWARDRSWVDYVRVVSWGATVSRPDVARLGFVWEDGILNYVRKSGGLISYELGFLNETTGMFDIAKWNVPGNSSWRHCETCPLKSNASASGADTSASRPVIGVVGVGTEVTCENAITGGLNDSVTGSLAAASALPGSSFWDNATYMTNTAACSLGPANSHELFPKLMFPKFYTGGWPTPFGATPIVLQLFSSSLSARSNFLWVQTELTIQECSQPCMAQPRPMHGILGLSFSSDQLQEDLLLQVKDGGVAFVFFQKERWLYASTHGYVNVGNSAGNLGQPLPFDNCSEPVVAAAGKYVLQRISEWASGMASGTITSDDGQPLISSRLYADSTPAETLFVGGRKYFVDFEQLVAHPSSMVVVIAKPVASTGVHKNGTRMFKLLLGCLVAILIGCLLLIIVMVRALLQDRKLQAALYEAKLNAESALHIKSMFLANMSHEMRTPLTAIQGYLDLLLNEYGHLKSMPVVEYATLAKVSSNTLLQIVNDVLDLEKLESNRMQMEEAEVDLENILEGVISMFSTKVDHTRVDIILCVSDACPRFVKGDAFRLKQIFMNLLSNSVRFTESGSIVIHMDAVVHAPPPSPHRHRRFSLSTPTLSRTTSNSRHVLGLSTSSHGSVHSQHGALARTSLPPARTLKHGSPNTTALLAHDKRGVPFSNSWKLDRSAHTRGGGDAELKTRGLDLSISHAGLPPLSTIVSKSPDYTSPDWGSGASNTPVSLGELGHGQVSRLPSTNRRSMSLHRGGHLRSSLSRGSQDGAGGAVSVPLSPGCVVELLVAVDDSGLGIPRDKWEKVFESFTQADISTTRTHGGTGLGLSIVRSLVQLMGGSIGIVAKDGPGTRVQFNLRLGAVPEKTRPTVHADLFGGDARAGGACAAGATSCRRFSLSGHLGSSVPEGVESLPARCARKSDSCTISFKDISLHGTLVELATGRASADVTRPESLTRKLSDGSSSQLLSLRALREAGAGPLPRSISHKRGSSEPFAHVALTVLPHSADASGEALGAGSPLARGAGSGPLPALSQSPSTNAHEAGTPEGQGGGPHTPAPHGEGAKGGPAVMVVSPLSRTVSDGSVMAKGSNTSLFARELARLKSLASSHQLPAWHPVRLFFGGGGANGSGAHSLGLGARKGQASRTASTSMHVLEGSSLHHPPAPRFGVLLAMPCANEARIAGAWLQQRGFFVVKACTHAQLRRVLAAPLPDDTGEERDTCAWDKDKVKDGVMPRGVAIPLQEAGVGADVRSANDAPRVAGGRARNEDGDALLPPPSPRIVMAFVDSSLFASDTELVHRAMGQLSRDSTRGRGGSPLAPRSPAAFAMDGEDANDHVLRTNSGAGKYASPGARSHLHPDSALAPSELAAAPPVLLAPSSAEQNNAANRDAAASAEATAVVGAAKPGAHPPSPLAYPCAASTSGANNNSSGNGGSSGASNNGGNGGGSGGGVRSTWSALMARVLSLERSHCAPRNPPALHEEPVKEDSDDNESGCVDVPSSAQLRDTMGALLAWLPDACCLAWLLSAGSSRQRVVWRNLRAMIRDSIMKTTSRCIECCSAADLGANLQPPCPHEKMAVCKMLLLNHPLHPWRLERVIQAALRQRMRPSAMDVPSLLEGGGDTPTQFLPARLTFSMDSEALAVLPERPLQRQLLGGWPLEASGGTDASGGSHSGQGGSGGSGGSYALPLPAYGPLGTDSGGVTSAEASVVSSANYPAGVADAGSAKDLLPPAPQPRPQEQATAHGLRVLVAEDNVVNQRLITKILRSLGHTDVCVVENGALAAERATSEQWDAILMDCQMPVLDGFQATRAIRAHEAGHGKRRVPIFALTAHTQPRDEQLCQEAGMSGFLRKPVDIALLKETLSGI